MQGTAVKCSGANKKLTNQAGCRLHFCCPRPISAPSVRGDSCLQPTLCYSKQKDLLWFAPGLYDGCLVDDFSVLSWTASLFYPPAPHLPMEGASRPRGSQGWDQHQWAETVRGRGWGLITYIEPGYMVIAHGTDGQKYHLIPWSRDQINLEVLLMCSCSCRWSCRS